MVIVSAFQLHVYLPWGQRLFKCLKCESGSSCIQLGGALVGAFSVITNLRMDIRFKLYSTHTMANP